MRVGASYYPELSDAATWRADLSTARSLGLEALRCGEFAWSRLSPQENAWETGWAREFLDVAGDLGFDVIWCTPSATPPPYLFDRWPGLTATNEHERRMPVGVRRNYCPSHAGYRKLCGETAVRLVDDLGDHPAIRGWQTDNEIAGDGFTCWCGRCARAFQKWLHRRYCSIDALNAAWQTDVWAQRYMRWKQIPVPQRAFASHAPALRLAWRRFRSDNWLRFHRAQYEPMKAAGAQQPITTNFFGVSWDMPFDQWAWRPYLDTMAIGQYVEDETAVRFEYALLRGIDDKELWVLEQKAGQQNAQNAYPEDTARIGRHLRVTKEAGAGYSIYWHLRQHGAGCEMEHGAVLRHDGAATRIAQAVARGIEDARTTPVAPRTMARVLAFDFHQEWAQETRPQPGTKWSYRETLEQDWHGAAVGLWGGCCVGPLTESLEKTGVVLAPHWQMLRDGELPAVEGFLRSGGTFVTTADFGRLDGENNVRPLPPLGALSPLVAMPVGEMLHLKNGFAVEGNSDGIALKGRHFWFVPAGSTDPHLTHGDLAGPAWLEYPVGNGRIVILTSAFDGASLQRLLQKFTA